MTKDKRPPARTLRAKHACRECNARRVRCNVTESSPCSNCQKSGAVCEVLPSRRGRYPRKSKNARPEHSTGTPRLRRNPDTPHSVTPGAVDNNLPPETSTPIPSVTTPPADDSTVASANNYYGESNFLTLMPGSSARNEDGQMDEGPEREQQGSCPSSNVVVPRSQAYSDSLSSGNANLTPSTTRYLHEEGALAFPELQSCMPALTAYFDRFHPAFPILDREGTARRIMTSTLSPILMHAMLFIGATYCEDETITKMGFRDRAEAKNRFYSRARVLFHADWEQDKMTLIQALFLISFWRGGPSDIRDVRYWLGIVISLAESQGLHRSTRIIGKANNSAGLRRRLWWSIYVRERQAAASLGLPSRIRDEDCDIESLEIADMAIEVPNPEGLPFGWCKPEHANYAIKMVEMAKLLGRAIDSYFLPGRSSPQSQDTEALDTALQAWWTSLPADVLNAHLDNAPVWTCLLHLAYYQLKILIHRTSFLRQKSDHGNNDITYQAAARISRIAEDMLTNQTLRFGQMHMITALFAALCIHVISIRRSVGAARRIAENRAQACLLSLQEIQKYWRINNNVLDLFMHYVEKSITQQLRGLSDETPNNQAPSAHQERAPTRQAQEESEVSTGWSKPQNEIFEDPHLFMWNGYWEGSDATGDLGMFLTDEGDFQPGSLSFTA